MAFDNIKLEKGLYTTSKGFTASLEELDPSENYIGTDYEGLDAYQRQLKRFDIKVSGTGSDTISKFFATTDSAALFPEYISRAVQQGLEEEDTLHKIIATTTNIDSLDYRAIESVPAEEDKELALVAEGETIPETTIRTKDKLTKLKKRGRMLVASYEAIKFQKLDLFTVTLKQIGAYIARTQFKDAIEVITNSDAEQITSASKTVTYEELVKLWNKLSPYKATTFIASVPAIADMLSITEFKDSNAGQSFHGTGKMITPFGAEVLRVSDDTESRGIIALDNSAALEKVQAGGVITEYDKLIDRQLERAAITTIAGFSTIFSDAAKILTCSE
ncbi:MAG: phage major capsid protein [Eubacterium sp.]|nr:phage major capsid protein [Eubacterium sp.]